MQYLETLVAEKVRASLRGRLSDLQLAFDAIEYNGEERNSMAEEKESMENEKKINKHGSKYVYPHTVPSVLCSKNWELNSGDGGKRDEGRRGKERSQGTAAATLPSPPKVCSIEQDGVNKDEFERKLCTEKQNFCVDTWTSHSIRAHISCLDDAPRRQHAGEHALPSPARAKAAAAKVAEEAEEDAVIHTFSEWAQVLTAKMKQPANQSSYALPAVPHKFAMGWNESMAFLNHLVSPARAWRRCCGVFHFRGCLPCCVCLSVSVSVCQRPSGIALCLSWCLSACLPVSVFGCACAANKFARGRFAGGCPSRWRATAMASWLC